MGFGRGYGGGVFSDGGGFLLEIVRAQSRGHFITILIIDTTTPIITMTIVLKPESLLLDHPPTWRLIKLAVSIGVFFTYELDRGHRALDLRVVVLLVVVSLGGEWD